MFDKIKGWRTIISGLLIIVAGAVLEYHAKCQNDPALVEICSKLTVPGWLISGLGIAVVWFRKLAGSGK
jgi:hypothetical protein